MIVAELVKIGARLMELLSKYDIKTDDYKYVSLFEDYVRMLHEGLKVTYIVTVLSDKYKLGQASVYRILKRFGNTINM